MYLEQTRGFFYVDFSALGALAIAIHINIVVVAESTDADHALRFGRNPVLVRPSCWRCVR